MGLESESNLRLEIGHVLFLVVVGDSKLFPIALVVAWAFELTPEGLKRAATPTAT